MIDFGLNKDIGTVVAESDVDLVWQQIDILFDTRPGEVFGQENYGTRYDRFLYDLTVSTDNIARTILEDIYSIELLGFRPMLKVYLLRGTQNDIIVADIVLEKQGDKYEKIYKVIE